MLISSFIDTFNEPFAIGAYIMESQSENIYFLILALVLIVVEILLSVSLCVLEDFNENDLFEIKYKLSASDINLLNKFLDDKNKYANRFHAALITAHMFLFIPVFCFFSNIAFHIVDHFNLKEIFVLLLFCVFLFVFLFINFFLFFLLPRKIIRHSSEYARSIFTLFSLKISIFMIPISDFSDYILKLFFKIIGKNKYNEDEKVTEDDILSMVQESNIEDDEVEMINNIFELNDKEAKDIMTNRNNIVAINADTSLSDAIKIMLEGSNSRYPVYIDNLDHIIGIIHLKDALRYKDANKSRDGAIKRYPKILREARFVSETRKIDDLFEKMKADKLQMVIVIDEYGQTSGLIAMEDILEEIVGNIMDEYDEEETFFEKKDEKTYEIDGLTLLEDLEDLIGIKLECEDDIETVNGFILNKLGYIPQNDDKSEFLVDGYVFKILQVENHMVKTVLIEKQS